MANEIVDNDLLHELQEDIDKIVAHFFLGEENEAFFNLGRLHEKLHSFHIPEDEVKTS